MKSTLLDCMVVWLVGCLTRSKSLVPTYCLLKKIRFVVLFSFTLSHTSLKITIFDDSFTLLFLVKQKWSDLFEINSCRYHCQSIFNLQSSVILN